MDNKKEEAMLFLLKGGMDKHEAEEFLDGRKVLTQYMQLPSSDALKIMNKMRSFSMLSGPVRFYIAITKENEQRLINLVSESCNKEIITGSVDPSKGTVSSFSSPFLGIDKSKIN